MARETKAERMARFEAERLERERVERETWPERLMATLEAARRYNFELQVEDGKFVVYDRDERHPEKFTMSYEYTGLADSHLSDLEWAVKMKKEEEEEANRRALVRQAALAKLSPEEKELLGLLSSPKARTRCNCAEMTTT